jgi:hypothetical protein
MLEVVEMSAIMNNIRKMPLKQKAKNFATAFATVAIMGTTIFGSKLSAKSDNNSSNATAVSGVSNTEQVEVKDKKLSKLQEIQKEIEEKKQEIEELTKEAGANRELLKAQSELKRLEIRYEIEYVKFQQEEQRTIFQLDSAYLQVVYELKEQKQQLRNDYLDLYALDRNVISDNSYVTITPFRADVNDQTLFGSDVSYAVPLSFVSDYLFLNVGTTYTYKQGMDKITSGINMGKEDKNVILPNATLRYNGMNGTQCDLGYSTNSINWNASISAGLNQEIGNYQFNFYINNEIGKDQPGEAGVHKLLGTDVTLNGGYDVGSLIFSKDKKISIIPNVGIMTLNTTKNAFGREITPLSVYTVGLNASGYGFDMSATYGFGGGVENTYDGNYMNGSLSWYDQNNNIKISISYEQIRDDVKKYNLGFSIPLGY